jgi:four helix bundle protein
VSGFTLEINIFIPCANKYLTLNRCIMGNFKKLRVWQNAKELAVTIYKLTKEKDLSKDYGLKDQIQRAAVSIASNIAEGDESGTDKMSIKHFYIAKGSTAELMTQLIIANEIGFINPELRDKLVDECDKILAMLSKLIKVRSQISGGR